MSTPTPLSGSNQDNRFGATTGIDLTAKIILNENPSDIESVGGHPPAYTQDKWRLFQIFLDGKDPINKVEPINRLNTELNSNKELKIQITQKYINSFNASSAWTSFGTSNPHRGINNPLTQEDIFAIQRFTKKTDPKAQIDGWLGTQTLQMNYPKITTLNRGFTDGSKDISPEFSNYLIAAAWGNKKFVINRTDLYNKQIIFAEKFIPYNPSIHTLDKFQGFSQDTLKKNENRNLVDIPRWSEWINIDIKTLPIINSSAEQINKETKKTQIQSSTKNLQASIIKNINK